MARRSRENPEGLDFFDSHCHLTDGQFARDLSPVIKRAHSAGVREMLTASQSVPDSRQAMALCRHHDGLYCAVGVHPHEADRFRSIDIQALKDMCIEPRVKAIGEIGLDFFRGISSRANQETAFQAQVELAKMLAMPMVIHIRDAASRARLVLEEIDYYSGVLHCFTADKKFAEWATEKGLYISFSGNVTYNEDRLIDIARSMPRERLMIETDAPYLAPGPKRRERNEPGYLRWTAELLAASLGMEIAAFAELTSGNARRCYGI